MFVLFEIEDNSHFRLKTFKIIVTKHLIHFSVCGDFTLDAALFAYSIGRQWERMSLKWILGLQSFKTYSGSLY